jgi:ABC-type transporter Mla maintaining outer membrane lipid asymmetry ATPase subunit MlaF
MKTAIHFQNAIKVLRGTPQIQVQDLRIFERESVAFYGLPHDFIESLANQMTGAYVPDEGSVTILGIDSRQISDDRFWFRFVENFGIYNAQQVFQEGASIGENVAMLYRLRNESMEEPQLSASVLNLANLVQLTITDLSKMMSESTPAQRMKVRLSRALAYHPKIVILCDPTGDLNTPVAQELVELLKRAKRKQKFTQVIFTSDVWLLQQIADRVIFLDPRDGLFIENQLRGWYHTLFPFLDPSPTQLLELSRDVLHYGRMMRLAETKMENSNAQFQTSD